MSHLPNQELQVDYSRLQELQKELHELRETIRWRDVNKELPKETCRCWCYVAEQNDLGLSHYQWNCSYVEGQGFSRVLSNSVPFLCDEYQGHVTHWRPLQEPPKDSCPKCEGYGEIETKEYSLRQDMLRSSGYCPGEPEDDTVEACPDCNGKGMIDK